MRTPLDTPVAVLAHGSADTACDQQDQAGFTPDDAGEVIGWLNGLDPELYGRQDPERIHAALVLASSGNLTRFVAGVGLLRLDWRDAVVAGGLADANWPERLDAELPTEAGHT
jgi:hypothetical protein